MATLPATPEELLEELFANFPQYCAAYDGPIHVHAPTFHSVMTAFMPFFGDQFSACSEQQLRRFGELVSAAVAAGGLLENAFGTCMLEHLHQIRVLRAFRPYLSKSAQERTRA